MSSTTIVGNLAVELGIKDAQLQAGLAQAVTQAQQAGAKMASAMNQGASQSSSGGLAGRAQGLLSISRAIDDVQYGFQGVINNIEGIAMGLGLGSGIAGAATIAAVAMNALVPRVLELVQAKYPIRDLAESIRGIGNSGISGTFIGMASEAKATQAAFEASAKILEGMQQPRMTVPAIGVGGPGMAAPAAAILQSDDPRKIFAQRLRVNELAQEAAKDAFRAQEFRQRVAAGGLAGTVKTTFDEEQTKLNQQIFQRAIDRFGGGQQLFDAMKMKNLGNPALFGDFQAGETKATEEAVRLLGLQAEKAKVLADDFERATGAAAELRRIEEESDKKRRDILNRQFGEYETGVKRFDMLAAQRDDILSQRNRTEILGSASEVFARNINAGMDDPQIKKLDEIKDEIIKLQPLIGVLQ